MKLVNDHSVTGSVHAGSAIRQGARAALVAVFALASAPAAIACTEAATRLLQAEADGGSAYVTRGIRTDNSAGPHRPEQQMDFPRR